MKHIVLLLSAWLALGPIAARADSVGVVLIHGKQGSPDAPHLAYISQQIEHAGFLLDRPTMCWSRTRIFDRTIADCMADIDASIGRLKSRGAIAFVIVGHSLGDRSTWCRFLAALRWEHNRATKPNHESQRCVRNERDDR